MSAIADATNATQRLYAVFEAETLEETQMCDPNLEAAIEVEGAEFTWDSPPPQAENHKKTKRARSNYTSVTDTTTDANEEIPFSVKQTNISVPRGQLIAIVGPVGAGKTSLLQGMIGEMRRTAGLVKFGGSVSYCPQSAWIQVSFRTSTILSRALNTVLECYNPG